MLAYSEDVLEALSPTAEQSQLAQDSSRKLGNVAKSVGDRLTLKVEDATLPNETIELPGPVVQMLQKILVHLAKGDAVSIVPSTRVLTTNEAADILNVSRPFLIKLLDAGKIKCHLVGTHRRVLFHDLLEYKRKMHQERLAALDEMANLSQEMGL